MTPLLWGADEWSAIADLMMAGAAIAAALAAYRGLYAWKTQEMWRTDSDLARRLLMALEEYKLALYAVRHPAVFPAETEISSESSKNLSDSERSTAGIRQAYAGRWSRLQTKRANLQVLFVEASAVWGDELAKKFAPTSELEYELYRVVYWYLKAVSGPEDESAAANEMLRKKRDILYDTLDDSDEFRQDYDRAEKTLVVYQRSKLGRKS